MKIQTSRLWLIPATAELVGLEISSREAFGQALGAKVPADWPPELLVDALPWFLRQLEADAQLTGWLCWYGVCREGEDDKPVLAASGGFFGPPQEGTVEVGYSTLPQFQGRGYATEMVEGLVNWAMSQPTVRRVIAEANSSNKASLRVLEKLGFAQIGIGRGPDSLQFERTSIAQER